MVQNMYLLKLENERISSENSKYKYDNDSI